MFFPPFDYDAEHHPAKSHQLWRTARFPGVAASGVGSFLFYLFQPFN